MKRSTTVLGAVLLAGIASSGCVTSGKYDAKVAELDQATKREQDMKAQIAQLEADREELRKRVDNATALVGELKGRLEKLGQNVDQLSSERGQLAAGLEEAKLRLEDLRKQKTAAEARAATFRTLVEKLRSMIDSGQIKVTIRNGRMLIALPNDVLFDSGKTAVKPDGQQAIAKVAQVLAGIPDRRFMVAGHTDDVPIKTARFPSNWELSSARAIEVTQLLTTNGMKPQVLAAAGYSQFDPVAANDSPDHRALNRRIEIVLEPNLSDLPNLDGLLEKK